MNNRRPLPARIRSELQSGNRTGTQAGTSAGTQAGTRAAIAAGIAALLLAAAPAGAADIEAGRKAAAPCAACHGNDGKTPTDPNAPMLAGQYADYLRKALRDYQTGARKNAIMGGLAKPMSKQDIENLSAYFESLPGPLTHRR